MFDIRGHNVVKLRSMMTKMAIMTTLTIMAMMKVLTMRTITAVVSFEMAATMYFNGVVNQSDFSFAHLMALL